MSAPVVLLLLLILLVIGTILFASLVQLRRARLELTAHVNLISGREGSRAEDQAKPAAEIPEWRKQLEIKTRHFFSVGLRHTWGMHAKPPILVILALLGSCAAWLLLRASLKFSLPISLGATVAAFYFAPRAWLKHEQGGFEQQFLVLFPDTIDMVIRMLRAGLPVTAAIRAVGNEAPAPMNGIFSHIADQMMIGIPFEDALSAAAGEIGLPDFRFFSVAISLQRTTGGNLAVTLDILSDIMRKRRATRQKAQATTGEVRMSAYVSGGIPILVIGSLLVMSPDYLQPLLSDPRGNTILGMATISMTIGFLTIRKMMRSVTTV